MSEYFRKPIVKILMLKGKDAVSIKDVEKKATSGLTDTYEITLTDGTKRTFNVSNGKGIESIAKTSTSGLTDTYTTTYNDGSTSTFTVKNGDKGDTGSIDNLKIGGRNYLLNSDETLTGGGSLATIRLSKDFLNQNLGKEITLSVKYTAENWTGKNLGFEFMVTYDDETHEYYGALMSGSANGNASVAKTIRLPTNKGKVKSVGYCTLFINGTSEGTATVYKPKLELGNIATDWTPSIEDIENEIASAKDILNKTYPVGSIYMSVNSTEPSTLFGGTWERLKGRFLIGAGTNEDINTNVEYGDLGHGDPNFAGGETGGQYYHQLTIDEMPEHTHNVKSTSVDGSGDWTFKDHQSNTKVESLNWQWGGTSISNTGGGNKHSNMPPYLAVYMWKRTA